MSTSSTVSQAVARPIRTAAQLSVSAALVEFVDAFITNLSDRQYAAALALLTLVLGFVQVQVEDHLGKGFFRLPSPPAGEAPVVGDVTDVPAAAVTAPVVAEEPTGYVGEHEA